ncbi:sensor histidine kinase [Lacticaseibacillus pabuli]|uniref:Sensor histidine kinase n=1 Tax=Lacticaseibacillus pabuli TaxID=3025672 RepID=A0ABY7WTY5_9LACO|nr:sensor histidine kinase [Lacticaseibacillus sp. KACC 23028]WDF83581.1 sensor histidine kinase [Lacticaseibacillus sp. KACC 23028]
MRKRTYFGAFSTIALLTLAFEFFIFWIVEGHDHPGQLTSDLGNNYYGMPIFVYAIFGAVVVGVVAIMISYTLVHSSQRQMSSRLSVLVGNQLNDKQAFADEATVATLGQENAVLLESVRQKVLRLQQEIARYSAQPVMVGGESKESILIEERHRIARELHDSVSQQLFAAMMMLSALRTTITKNDPEASQKQVHTIERVINSAQSEMRALLLHLRPTSLAGRSLKKGIIGLLKELQTKINIRITWQLSDVELPAAVEDNLFRIVQELLSNTLRHANAEELEVYLATAAQTVILRVVDDGVGFDTTKQVAAGSYGLQNIKERATAIGGTANVISFPNQGTTVEIRVPITKEETHDDKSTNS